jgi:hypothetical protein
MAAIVHEWNWEYTLNPVIEEPQVTVEMLLEIIESPSNWNLMLPINEDAPATHSPSEQCEMEN